MPNETRITAKGEVCGCPCKHAGPIEIRTGFVVCTTGGEKLCNECIAEGGPPFECHTGHSE